MGSAKGTLPIIGVTKLSHVEDAVKSGKTRYIGISNCFAWQLAKANFYAREHSLTEFVSI